MLPDIVWGLVFPPAWAVGFTAIARVVLRRPRRAEDFWEAWAAGAGGVTIGAAFGGAGYLAQIAVGIAQFVFAAVMWWLSRRKRKRAPKLAGAKSRALLAAVVRTMRERTRVRPVLKPVPGGARA